MQREQRQSYDNGVIAAFLTSRWVWKKRVDVEKFLHKQETREMSDEEMLKQVRALNALMGGTINKQTAEGGGTQCPANQTS